MRNKPSQIALCVIAALLLPFVVKAAYLSFTRILELGMRHDLEALAVSVFFGAACLWLMPLNRTQRLLLVVIYVPFVAVTLFAFALLFVCKFFGDCL